MDKRMRETNFLFPLPFLETLTGRKRFLVNNVPRSYEVPKDDFFSIHLDLANFTLFNN